MNWPQKAKETTCPLRADAYWLLERIMHVIRNALYQQKSKIYIKKKIKILYETQLYKA